MAEVATIPAQETGPEAPPPAIPTRPENVPEKFWDATTGTVRTDDLIKSYSELEKTKAPAKPEGEKPKDGEESPKDEAKKEDAPVEKTDEDRTYEKETYGEALASVFDKAGIIASKVSQEFHDTGKFPEDAYTKLAEQGYSRAVVDNYLRGAADSKTEQVNVATADVVAIKAMAGGDDGYNQMVEWAKASLPKEDIEAYNEAVSSGKKATAEMAVRAMHSRFTEAEGKDPKLLTGGDKPGADVFRSTAEVNAAIQDPRYSKDTAYRKDVEAKLLRSNVFQGGKK